MIYMLYACLIMQTVSLYALAPSGVRKLRTEFSTIVQQTPPDTHRAQQIIDELRTAKEMRVALELEKDLQKILLAITQQEQDKEVQAKKIETTPTQQASTSAALQADMQRLQQISLELIDKVNMTDALLGQAISAAHDNQEIKSILDQIAQQHDALRVQRDEIMRIALPS